MNFDPEGKDIANFLKEKQGLEGGISSSRLSPFAETKKALHEILSSDDVDYDEVLKLRDQGIFKGKEGESLYQSLSNLLNTKFAENVNYLFDEWCPTYEIELENEDDQEAAVQAREDIESLFKSALLKATKQLSPTKDELDFLNHLYSVIVKDFLAIFVPESKRDAQQSAILAKTRYSIAESFLSEYPLVSKSLLHSFTSKKYSVAIREQFDQVALKSLEDYFQKGFDETINTADIGLIEIFSQLFELIFSILIHFHLRYGEMYQNYWIFDIRKKMEAAHNRKNLQQSLLEKPLSEVNESFDFIPFFDNQALENSEEKQKIEATISDFVMEDSQKKYLIKKIFRLYKNNKPFKVIDYMGDSGFVSVKDEGKLLNLVDDLGIEIQYDDEKKEDQKLNPESDSLSVSIKKTGDTFDDRVVFDLNKSEEELAVAIFEQLEDLGYEIKNRKQLAKQIIDCLKFGADKKSVLAAFGNPELMNTRTFKNGQIYSISLTPKNRLILIKEGNSRVIDSFYTDHDAYEDRIDAIK